MAQLAKALIARGMRAAAAGRAVRVWQPGNEDGSVWVVPGWTPGGAAVWSWQQGERSQRHPRHDIAGIAEAAARFLAAPTPADG